MELNVNYCRRLIGLLWVLTCTSLPAAEPQGWFDQLDKINPSKHAVEGSWRSTPEGLRTEAAAGSRIAVPASVPREYDFRVQFTRHSGQHSIALFFTSGVGRATFELDAWGQHLAGVQQIGGQSLQVNPTRVANQRLENGRRYTAEIHVRQDSVAVLLDGQLLATYRGDGSNLSLIPLWEMPHNVQLGVGAYEAEATFHSIELRQVAGKPMLATGDAAIDKTTPSNPRPVPAASRPAAALSRPTRPPTPAMTKAASPLNSPANARRVLIVIANQHFFYREYADPRQELERAGFAVEVAAGQRSECYPHANSGESGDGRVRPDLALSEVDPDRYEAVVFSGGWGASMYQYGFPGRYDHAAYNGNPATKSAANDVIAAFSKAGKYICGICNGVSVLAWSRVDGSSLLAGKTVTAPTRAAPAGVYNGQRGSPSIRWHVQQNQGRLVPAGSIGNPRSAADDVVVDGTIITAEDDQSAREAGRRLAELLRR